MMRELIHHERRLAQLNKTFFPEIEALHSTCAAARMHPEHHDNFERRFETGWFLLRRCQVEHGEFRKVSQKSFIFFEYREAIGLPSQLPSAVPTCRQVDKRKNVI